MATKTIRIGSLEDIHEFDSEDFDTAIETDSGIDIKGVLNCEGFKVDGIQVIADQQAAIADAAADVESLKTTINEVLAILDACIY